MIPRGSWGSARGGTSSRCRAGVPESRPRPLPLTPPLPWPPAVSALRWLYVVQMASTSMGPAPSPLQTPMEKALTKECVCECESESALPPAFVSSGENNRNGRPHGSRAACQGSQSTFQRLRGLVYCSRNPWLVGDYSSHFEGHWIWSFPPPLPAPTPPPFSSLRPSPDLYHVFPEIPK